MTWTNLLANKEAQKHKTSKKDDELRLRFDIASSTDWQGLIDDELSKPQSLGAGFERETSRGSEFGYTVNYRPFKSGGVCPAPRFPYASYDAYFIVYTPYDASRQMRQLLNLGAS